VALATLKPDESDDEPGAPAIEIRLDMTSPRREVSGLPAPVLSRRLPCNRPSALRIVGPESLSARANKQPDRATGFEVKQALCAMQRRSAAPAVRFAAPDRCGLRQGGFCGGRKETHGFETGERF
jgi:hypothetical protein